MFYTIFIVTRDDPRNMILKYKKQEIKFMEEYKEYGTFRFYTRKGYKMINDIKHWIRWVHFHENNKVFHIHISVYCSLKKNVLKEIDVTNIETDSITKMRLI